MTAVTVTEKKEITGNLGMEVVKGTFTDGYTYNSKFGTILFAVAQSESRAGTYCSVSSSTVTLHCSSASGDTFELLIIGK